MNWLSNVSLTHFSRKTANEGLGVVSDEKFGKENLWFLAFEVKDISQTERLLRLLAAMLEFLSGIFIYYDWCVGRMHRASRTSQTSRIRPWKSNESPFCFWRRHHASLERGVKGRWRGQLHRFFKWKHCVCACVRLTSVVSVVTPSYPSSFLTVDALTRV